MTARVRPIDRAAAEAWQAVRWAASDGRPVCPTCFDGQDLEPRPADPRNPALHRYHCTTCKRNLSDWSDTWLAPLKAPLVRWAWLALFDGDGTCPPGPDVTGRQIGVRHHTIVGMRAKLATAPPAFLAAWRQALQARGCTVGQLARAARIGRRAP
jgi:hypothetical protein